MIGEVGKDSEILVIREAVRVKIPKKSGDMEFRQATPIPNGEVIPPRWHNAIGVDGIMVNRNFYGFTGEDLGKTRTATVQIYVKTVEGKGKFTAMDIFKAENGSRATCTLRYTTEPLGKA